MKLIPLSLFALLLCLGLTHCTSTDPAFTALQAQAETNPRPHAILGMWHRRAESGNLATHVSTRSSLMFKPDGTVLGRSQMYFNGVAQVSEAQNEKYAQSGKWSYSGNGVWLLAYPGSNPFTIRLSGGNLLVTGGQGGFVGNTVYTRVE